MEPRPSSQLVLAGKSSHGNGLCLQLFTALPLKNDAWAPKLMA